MCRRGNDTSSSLRREERDDIIMAPFTPRIIIVPISDEPSGSREGYDLLGCTQNMADHIKTKWTNPEMSTEQLEAYVNSQFDELHRLVRLEEKRTLHLVDLKEAFLTAAAAEKIAEITVHTERLQEEMACITQQLGQLDQAEAQPGAGVAAIAQGGPCPRPAQRDIEARPRLPEPRRDPQDPRDYGEGGSRSSMGHAP